MSASIEEIQDDVQEVRLARGKDGSRSSFAAHYGTK